MRPDTRRGPPRMLAPEQPQQPPHAWVWSGYPYMEETERAGDESEMKMNWSDARVGKKYRSRRRQSRKLRNSVIRIWEVPLQPPSSPPAPRIGRLCASLGLTSWCWSELTWVAAWCLLGLSCRRARAEGRWREREVDWWRERAEVASIWSPRRRKSREQRCGKNFALLYFSEPRHRLFNFDD